MLFLFVCGHRFFSSFPFDFPRAMRILVASSTLSRYKYSCDILNQLYPSVSVTPALITLPRTLYVCRHLPSIRLSARGRSPPDRPLA